MIITLNQREMTELLKTSSADEDKGGFQKFIVGFQNHLSGNDLNLTAANVKKIQKYAAYTSGGYQSRLKKIFSRHLGPNLDQFTE